MILLRHFHHLRELTFKTLFSLFRGAHAEVLTTRTGKEHINLLKKLAVYHGALNNFNNDCTINDQDHPDSLTGEVT
jgi:hypothetical protein